MANTTRRRGTEAGQRRTPDYEPVQPTEPAVVGLASNPWVAQPPTAAELAQLQSLGITYNPTDTPQVRAAQQGQAVAGLNPLGNLLQQLVSQPATTVTPSEGIIDMPTTARQYVAPQATSPALGSAINNSLAAAQDVLNRAAQYQAQYQAQAQGAATPAQALGVDTSVSPWANFTWPEPTAAQADALQALGINYGYNANPQVRASAQRFEQPWASPVSGGDALANLLQVISQTPAMAPQQPGIPAAAAQALQDAAGRRGPQLVASAGGAVVPSNAVTGAARTGMGGASSRATQEPGARTVPVGGEAQPVWTQTFVPMVAQSYQGPPWQAPTGGAESNAGWQALLGLLGAAGGLAATAGARAQPAPTTPEAALGVSGQGAQQQVPLPQPMGSADEALGLTGAVSGQPAIVPMATPEEALGLTSGTRAGAATPPSLLTQQQAVVSGKVEGAAATQTGIPIKKEGEGAAGTAAGTAAATTAQGTSGGTGSYSSTGGVTVPAEAQGWWNRITRNGTGFVSPLDPTGGWTNEDWLAITSATGSPMTRDQGLAWLNAFAAEHGGQYPWQVGSFGDPINNLIDHLFAKAESEQAVASYAWGSKRADEGNIMAEGVSPDFWTNAYYTRYYGPTMIPGFGEGPNQYLYPGQIPAPWWPAQRMFNILNDNWSQQGLYRLAGRPY